jgi:hypothetical protein
MMIWKPPAVGCRARSGGGFHGECPCGHCQPRRPSNYPQDQVLGKTVLNAFIVSGLAELGEFLPSFSS